ncbi:MAG: zinc-dependent metalloprotease [Bacteroidetes bacterium SB0662_bin_6]|nr:zinc-dependent metalloprotease [Bacteroidetes bacterium SB0668_bin_1]MYE04918.1 zinc-dependent metalloprotease [Bacteroidetes bacterium SB0662_bin_6]
MNRFKIPSFLTLLSLAVLLGGCSMALQTAVTADSASTDTQAAAGPDDETKMKKYSEVVKESMTTDEGLFAVHRDTEKTLFEIPDSLLDREMLLVTRMARTHAGMGYGGQKANTQVLRWQRQGDKVLLRIVSYESVASEDHPIYQAVRNANLEPVVAAFDILARNDDSTRSVVDVTELFTTDVRFLGLSSSNRERYEVRSLDKDRSYVNGAQSFPRNIEVRHTLTYAADEPPDNPSTGTISVEMNQSMVLLPDQLMTPRPCDARVGYFNVETIDYGADTQRAEEKCFITKWRLEPSDPEAFARGELVEPVRPIVYYIDPATPMKWRPYIKQGVDDWNVAFEEAGFRNAIIGKDPPSVEEDPEFSPEDVRYSVIRYFPSDIENAYGPHVHDPRSGEILESDIGWYHNVMNLLRNWYFVQTAASNPDARAVKFDDEVMGELIRFVSAHEVGHTIGLPHNWGSSYAFSVDSLRSPTFTSAYGTTPSIMDYARFNYIAQPEDGVTHFIPMIGEYDKWSVRWGYRPIPGADNEEEIKAVLNGWVKERAGDPLYFYGRQTGNPLDPRSQREDLGDDAVEASRLGVANLQRIVPNLIDWTREEGENYAQLEEIYGEIAIQWRRYLGHVAREIGGVYETPKTYDQDGPVYEMVSKDAQTRAMAFLHEFGFDTPLWFVDEDILRRIEHAGAVERIRSIQAGQLDLLLDPQRLARLIEAEARLGDAAYAPLDMLEDLRKGLWRELDANEAIDPWRRNLQRAYLEDMERLMTQEVTAPSAAARRFLGFTPVDVSQSDIRAYVRGELETLRGDVRRAARRMRDRPTALHLEDVLVRIENILDPQEE